MELKKEIMSAIDKLNMAWVEAVREGSKPESDGIDLTEVMQQYSGVMTELDEKWNQGMIRLKDRKHKNFF